MLFKTETERIIDFKKLLSCNVLDQITSPNEAIDWELFTDWLIEEGFFKAPASTKYHGVYDGGLYDHSRCVFTRLKKLTDDNELIWTRDESPFIIGMFHDLCKYDQYVKKTIARLEGSTIVTETGGFEYEYNTKTLLKGHGTKSIMLLSQFITLTEEEMLCIRYHMGAYGNEQEQKDEWNGLDLAIKKAPHVLFTHLADMMASKIDNT